VAVDVSLDELAGEDAPRALAQLRASSPAAWVEAIGGWLVTSHELAVAVLRDAATFTVEDPRFSTARVVGQSMLSLDGAAHRRHRAPFAPPFRPAQVSERFEARIDWLPSGEPVAIHPESGEGRPVRPAPNPKTTRSVVVWTRDGAFLSRLPVETSKA